MSEQFYDSWREQWRIWQDQNRLSLVDFVRLTKMYLSRISVAREGIQRTYVIFDEQEIVKADQCNEAISHMHTMDKPVEDFSQFLDQKTHLPLIILPLRYLPGTEITAMKEQLWKVKALIGRFRSSSRNVSRETALQHYEILRKLEKLLQSSEDVIQLSQAMFDQARFEEHRNSNTLPSFPHQKKVTRGSLYEFSSYQKNNNWQM